MSIRVFNLGFKWNLFQESRKDVFHCGRGPSLRALTPIPTRADVDTCPFPIKGERILKWLLGLGVIALAGAQAVQAMSYSNV